MVDMIKARVLRKCFVSNRLYEPGAIAYVHPRKLRKGIIVDYDEYEKARAKQEREDAKKPKGRPARLGPMSEQEQAELYEERLAEMRTERAPVMDVPLPDLEDPTTATTPAKTSDGG
jgi:hypothetical protein